MIARLSREPRHALAVLDSLRVQFRDSDRARASVCGTHEELLAAQRFVDACFVAGDAIFPKGLAFYRSSLRPLRASALFVLETEVTLR